MSAQGLTYPASTGSIKINPTIANAIVTKFEPEGGYRVTEVIEDETGCEALWNFIDGQSKFDVELVPKTGFTAPTQGTELTFTVSAATNAMALPGTATSSIKMLITSPVKITSDNGKVGKYSFSGLINVNVV